MLKFRFHLFAAGLGALAAGSVVATMPAAAQQSGLEGSWRGGGRVVFPSGESERASCRASFNRAGNTFRMSAVCATPSARVTQSAELQRVSATQYSGSFFNPEYNVSGDISIVVRGDRLSARLAGGGGSASFNLSR